VGILSRERDRFRPVGQAIESLEDLVALVNRLNAEWVTAARRMSPRVLRTLLAVTGPEVEEYFSSLDPMALGGPVSWAGPDPAPIWFDLAREFTERWHHQQQIRDATSRPPLFDPYFLAPVLDAFARVLPYTFRNTSAPPGTVVRFEISGDAGGVWFVRRTDTSWRLEASATTEPSAIIVLPQDSAWKVFTKGLTRSDARARATVRGDEALAAAIFTATAIIG
jgi:hypothetical protein